MVKRDTNAANLCRIARDEFGYDALRPGQETAMRAVLDGYDTLAVMPTGSGKSAIYQIASLLLPGPTIIVSPLIALQRDQVEAIEENGAGNAALLNSKIRATERREALDGLQTDDVQFLFLAPEQFGNADVLNSLTANTVQLRNPGIVRTYALATLFPVVAGFPACRSGRGGRLESLLPPFSRICS